MIEKQRQILTAKQRLLIATRRSGKTIRMTLQMTDYICRMAGYSDKERQDVLRQTAMTFGLFLSHSEAKKIQGVTIDFVTFDEATNA